jgi:hypothetical protein
MDSKEAFFAILKRIKEAWNSIGKGDVQKWKQTIS